MLCQSFISYVLIVFTLFIDSPTSELAVPVTQKKRMFLVDGGLMFNLPYPPLLRPQRKVDVYLSFEFSARKSDFDENPLQVIQSLKTLKNCL